MKKRTIAASSALLLLVVGGCTTTPRTPDSGPAVEATKDGVVTAMEEDSLSVRTPAGKELTFRTTEETTLLRGERRVGWDALAEGSSVRVGYDAGEGMGVARSVQILADPLKSQPWERQEHLKERFKEDLNQLEDAYNPGGGRVVEDVPAPDDEESEELEEPDDEE